MAHPHLVVVLLLGQVEPALREDEVDRRCVRVACISYPPGGLLALCAHLREDEVDRLLLDVARGLRRLQRGRPLEHVLL